MEKQKDWEKEFEETCGEYIKNISIAQYDENGVNIGYINAEAYIRNFIYKKLHTITQTTSNYMKKIYCKNCTNKDTEENLINGLCWTCDADNSYGSSLAPGYQGE